MNDKFYGVFKNSVLKFFRIFCAKQAQIQYRLFRGAIFPACPCKKAFDVALFLGGIFLPELTFRNSFSIINYLIIIKEHDVCSIYCIFAIWWRLLLFPKIK